MNGVEFWKIIKETYVPSLERSLSIRFQDIEFEKIKTISYTGGTQTSKDFK